VIMKKYKQASKKVNLNGIESRLRTTITGLRILLRPVTLTDAPIINRWHNDPEIIQKARAGIEKTTMQQEKDDIKTARGSIDQAYHLIVTKSNNTPIGFLRIHIIDKHSGNVWLRIIIGDKNSRGKGYAADALKVYLKWIFNKLGMHRVTLECYATNKRAIKFYRKIGFKQEGTLREAVLINGKFRNIISLGMLHHDFKE
jgi:ribosomal-protein-alanine N-acetyltransferase